MIPQSNIPKHIQERLKEQRQALIGYIASILIIAALIALFLIL